MAAVSKTQSGTVNTVVQWGIGRVLQAQYDDIARETLPASFTDLLVRLENKERMARLNARVERLRQGLKGPEQR